MTRSSAPALHEHIREEAINWLVAFSEGEVTGSARLRFDAWLRASPQNVRAYIQVSAIWEAAGILSRSKHNELDELVRKAGEESNVIALETSKREVRALRIPLRPQWMSWALAAGVILMLSAGAVLWSQLAPPAYATHVGEQRRVMLADGSTVQLNANSRIVVRFSDAERVVELTGGQALFQVAKNPARPFIVRSDAAQVRAVGTQFDVDRSGSGTVVTVVEGRVTVLGIGGAPELGGTSAAGVPEGVASGIMLAAGDQVTINQKAIVAPVHTNPTDVTAWTKGKLVFDSTPLADVVVAFNRYHAKPLIINDREILAFHVSGTFSTADPEQLVRFLAQRFGLHIRESADAIRLTHE